MIHTNQLDRLARAAEAYRRGDLSRHEFQGLVLAALGQLGEGDEIQRILLPREIAQVWQNVNELLSGKPLISVGSTPHLEVENENTGAHVFDIFIRRGTETFRNLDFPGAARNVLTDARGDWFQDPWELQEVKWLSERGQHVLDATLISLRPPVYGTAADVPKSTDSSRPATILDPLGRLIYQAIVDAESTRLTSHLANWTYGWRVRSGSMIPGEYVQNQFEWTEYLRRISEDAEVTPNALRSDIENFFSSINTDGAIPTLFSDASHAEYVTRLVNTWNEQTGRLGLPQRCLASSVIANGFLAKVEDVVTNKWHPSSKAVEGSVSAVRWMDDFWIFTPPRISHSEIEAPFRGAIDTLGLTLNEDKTSWLREEELFYAVAALDFSYELTALESEESDPTPLVERAESMLQDAALGRTEVTFLAKTALHHSLDEILDMLASHLDKLQAGIDQVCRAFRETGRWVELEDWFVLTLRSSENAWVKSSIFKLLPKQTAVKKEVLTVIEETAGHTQDYTVLSAALGYLSHWAPSSTIEIVRKRVSDCDNPAFLRAMALSGARAKMGRTEITQILNQFPECFATLEMLRDTNFRLQEGDHKSSKQ